MNPIVLPDEKYVEGRFQDFKSGGLALTQENLRRHAERFRLAIERCDRSLLPVTFEGFPRGSCGDTSLLLGAYLTDQGFGVFEYVAAERGSRSEYPSTWTTHAWIRQGNIILDITADQFPEILEKVIVTHKPSWHDGFTQRTEFVADYRIFEHAGPGLGTACWRIVTVASKLPA